MKSSKVVLKNTFLKCFKEYGIASGKYIALIFYHILLFLKLPFLSLLYYINFFISDLHDFYMCKCPNTCSSWITLSLCNILA